MTFGVKANRLSKESSPYLLQHAYNPVDWFPWGEEAFALAAKMDRPIFLSIGYASCHWCHVMESECFEDDDVADALNSNFINIKVDREERPDIDGVYMKACQMLSGSGGWPLSIFMTPDRRPFYAATFIPKSSRYGIPGMLDLIPTIVRTWKERREDIDDVALRVSSALSERKNDDREASLEGFSVRVFEDLLGSYEEKYGGFEIAPKFPTPHKTMFLLRHWRATGDVRSYSMAEHTLRRMCMGGIRDHVGGGFHRYSTDRRWMVPHFEKMLYDQALISIALIEMYQASGTALFRDAAVDAIGYALRDLRDTEGGFYSSEDADSPEGEGAYYIWTVDELNSVLPHDDAKIVTGIFDVRPSGNFKEEGGRAKGRNILHMEEDLVEFSSKKGLNPSAVRASLDRSIAVLKDVRDKRERPRLDDKVLLDWNGLMIVALSRAGRAFDATSYIDVAKRTVEFIEEKMTLEDGSLLHRYRDGQAGIRGFLTDHAYYAWGLIELYQATLEDRYLQLALKRAGEMNEKFSELKGGFVTSREDDLIAKEIDLYDGAIPSGNSVAILVDMMLAEVGGPLFSFHAEKALRRSSNEVLTHPDAHCFLAIPASMQKNGVTTVKVVKDLKDSEELLKMIGSRFIPDIFIIASKKGELREGALAQICRSRMCLEPVREKNSLLEQLEEKR